VQRRQPAAGHGAVSRKAFGDPALSNLDDTGTARLATLRGACVGCVFYFHSRARRRAGCGNGRAEQGTDGSSGVAVGVRVVPGGPTRVAIRDGGRAKRQPRTRYSTRMGASVRVILDVLAGADADYGCGVVVVGIIPMEYLASRYTKGTQPILFILKILKSCLTLGQDFQDFHDEQEHFKSRRCTGGAIRLVT